MKNLFKNTLRSFPKNKLSIVSLVFLIFLCLSIFCTMSNTFSNISTQYETIVNDGKLHDLVVSELYDIGEPSYEITNSEWLFLNDIEIKDSPQSWWDYVPVVLASIGDDPDYYETISKKQIAKYVYVTNDNIETKITWEPIEELPLFYDETDKKIKIEKDGKIEKEKYRFCCINKNDKPSLKFPFYILPEIQIKNGKIAALKYNFKLSEKSIGLFKDFAKKNIKDLTNFGIIVETNDENSDHFEIFNELDQAITKIDDKQNLKWGNIINDNEDCEKFSKLLYPLIDEISKKLQMQKKVILDELNPLSFKLKQYNDKIVFKNFCSFTMDSNGITTKAIKSNPTDQIDKIVLFPDKKGNKGYDLFDVNDYAPNGSNFTFSKLDENKYQLGEKVNRLTVPKNINELFNIKLLKLDDLKDEQEKFLYAQILQKRFKWMCNGKINYLYPNDNEKMEKCKDIVNCILKLGTTEQNDSKKYCDLLFNGDLKKDYQKYFDEFYQNEFINSDSIFLTIQWFFAPDGTISGMANKVGADGKKTQILSCEIHNLFDLFTILNPEYMKQNNKEVIAQNMFTDFKPFVEWYKQKYKSENIVVNKNIIIDWLNWITYDEYIYWLTGKQPQKFKLPNDEKNKNQHHETMHENWKGIDKKYLCNCSNFDFIIIGCGITPDFIYPSIDLTKLIANPRKDCLMYLNDGGFKQLQLAHVNAPIENFVVCKFLPHVSDEQKRKIVEDIRDLSKKYMVFPDGVNNVFFNDDKSNQLNANTFRITYLPSIIKLFKIVSYIICAFILLLTVIICIIIVKYYVDSNKVNIGILLANGIKKGKIIFSLLPFVWVPSVVGGVGAYLFGLFMQIVGLKLFKNYWFLPTKLISFNYITMLLCICFPFVLFSLTSFFSTLKMLNLRLTYLLNKQSGFKGSLFSRIAKIPFSHFGIMTRFRIASAFSSFWRLLILSATISITMSGTVFSVATLGKIDESNKLNSNQFKYKYAIDLVTPTASGGNYNTFNFCNDNEVGFFQTDSNKFIFNTMVNQVEIDPQYYPELTKPYYSNQLNSRYEKNEISGGVADRMFDILYSDDSMDYFWAYSMQSNDSKYTYLNLIKSAPNDNNEKKTTTAIGSLALFNEGDQIGKDIDLFYLQNKSISKLALDHDLGHNSIYMQNPWKTAISMMPLNYQNLADKSFNELIQKVGQKIYDDPKNKNPKWYQPWEIGKDIKVPERFANKPENAYEWFIEKDGDKYKLSTENKRFAITSTSNANMAFNPYFIKLLQTIYSDPELSKGEFAINYGSIPLNFANENNENADETYTYIDISIDNVKESLRVLGIKDNSKHVELYDHDNNDLLKKLHGYKQKNKDLYPLVINAYISFKNNWKVGDIITFKPQNAVDRFLKQRNSEMKFEIIGIAKSTANALFFTTQYFANKILGLPDGQNWNKTHKYMLWTDKDNHNEWQTKSAIVDLASNSEYLDIYVFNPNEGKFEKLDLSTLNDNEKAKFKNKHLNDIPIGFNGVFTKSKIIDSYLRSISLYSPSGLYPATSSFVSEISDTGDFFDILNKDKSGHNLALANFVTGLNNEKIVELIRNKSVNEEFSDPKIIQNFCEQIANVYGKTAAITTIKTADDLTTLGTIFNGLMDLFNLIQAIVVAIFFPIAILIVMVISSLLIKQNQKYAIMLKSLGYSDLQNAKNILSLYVPVSIIGIFVSIPFTMLLATSYQKLILNSMKILIYSLPKITHYLIGCGVIFGILATCALYGYYTLKKVKLNKEIKAE